MDCICKTFPWAKVNSLCHTSMFIHVGSENVCAMPKSIYNMCNFCLINICANSFVTCSVRYVVCPVLYATCLVLCNKPRYRIGFAKKLQYRYAIYSFERHEKRKLKFWNVDIDYNIGLNWS